MNDFIKFARALKWLPSYALRKFANRGGTRGKQHLIIALADHFEPPFSGTPRSFRSIPEQIQAVRTWCARYPNVVDEWRDGDQRPFVHTYFYPAEHYHPDVVEILAQHCHSGWGEIEVHLHHGVDAPDTADNTRNVLLNFRDALVAHGCLSSYVHDSTPRYAFVHGNWALANSGGGRFCGVDSEMQILQETGCYADFTLPSFPDRSQISKINSLYECALPLDRTAPHRQGHDLSTGRKPSVFPLIMQGPLNLCIKRRHGLPVPGFDNAELASYAPPTGERLKLWRKAEIGVVGRPEWCFIKLHCHGMAPWDEATLMGNPMSEFLRELAAASQRGEFEVHFVTAREMFNIALAACDEQRGSPSDYRDYQLKCFSRPSSRIQATPQTGCQHHV